MDRRSLMVGALGAVAVPSFAGDVRVALGDVERRHGGRLGVFAIDLVNNRTLGWRADERFKLYSTFKGLLAGLVLRDVSRGLDAMDARVRFGRSDLLPASPLTTAAVDKGDMSVEELCEAIMHRSDNTAANLLMARRGGPARLTAFLRELGDRVTRVPNYEGRIVGRPADEDTTTPRAIVCAARALLIGSALPVAARVTLERWMAGNVVGRSRLRAAFPGDWTSGDRTGTGDGYCNDYAFARRDGRPMLLVSAFHASPSADLAAQEAALRDVGRTVVAWQRGERT